MASWLCIQQYVILKRGTSKNNKLLQDPQGYQYTMKPRCGDNAVVYWRCVVRNRNNYTVKNVGAVGFAHKVHAQVSLLAPFKGVPFGRCQMAPYPPTRHLVAPDGTSMAPQRAPYCTMWHPYGTYIFNCAD